MELQKSTKKKLEDTRKTMEVFTLFVTVLGIAAYMFTKAGPWYVFWAERGQSWTAWTTLVLMGAAALIVSMMALMLLMEFLLLLKQKWYVASAAIIFSAFTLVAAAVGVTGETLYEMEKTAAELTELRQKQQAALVHSEPASDADRAEGGSKG
ncbi:hypothetical protein PhaeoP23_03700 (plasmid) [Phaeobacter piscinae]|uniref:Uncharacterized protein n=1 Tax=Phaeobacter piscinae TaxID=1580596 RepID=A0ABM6PJ16_9RHOB|nr:hypothetical protein [Phaeobacter piscinae]ATG37777.1 hypothetical protein PhaeoP36_03700 [Phaeobacter piscinae]AUQ88298.1 hypothetical protein PhaeoP42_03701 [Phaeobacter piscinae]AUR26181.1 hypothetical protein PhaeoP23_03700 [Phaeobacter piscinae]